MHKIFHYMRFLQVSSFIMLYLSFLSITSAQVGIGTSNPHSSAQLEVNSSTKGFLPPRVALTATNAATPVSSPEVGLLVFNTATASSGTTAVTPGYYYWSFGSAWVRLIVPSDNVSNVTGTVAIANGGTGQTTLSGLKTTLGLSGSSVAIASNAGLTNQGGNSIAIGEEAGKTSQSTNAIAIGAGAGRTSQGVAAIGIGYVTGDGSQGNNAIAIGGNAAQSNQATQAVAVGYAAGQYSQGANAVAIGAGAGQSSQVANSIAINATGESAPLNPANAGLYINPIRSAAASNSFLYYDDATKEVTHAAASTPTYIYSIKSSTQSIATNTSTIITGWTNSVSLNAGEWNTSTGVFTATKAGYYLVSVNVTYEQHAASATNAEYNVYINKVSGGSTTTPARAWMFAESTASTLKPTGSVSAIVLLAVGDELSIGTFHSSGATRSLYASGNSLVIQELPSKIVR